MRQFTKEHRRKLSEARKGIKLSEETKQRMSEARKGIKLSEETKQRMSEARKGIKLSEETKQRMSEARKGIKLSEETKHKMKMSSQERYKNEKDTIDINSLKFEHKIIKGYEKYLITANGEIYFILNNGLLREKKLSTMKTNKYKIVCLINNQNIQNIKYVHRLVAENFIGESELEVDHIDRNTENNNVSNLRWVTHSDNLKNRKFKKDNAKQLQE